MKLHSPSGRPIVGLALGLFAAAMWGTLPVMLKILVRWLDVYTITWCRFFIAGLLLLPLAVRTNGFGRLVALRGIPLVLLVFSVLGLTGNYLTFMGGLTFISPGTAQIVIQLSPVFMLLAGLLIFGERFSRLQSLGLAVVLLGMALFFSPRYDLFVTELRTQGLGVGLMVLSAALWGTYMVTQKQLLQDLHAEVILVVIYLGGALLLVPFIELPSLAILPALGVGLLLASSVMTMASYLTFAMALEHLEASRIGVLVSLTPIIVMINMELLMLWRPGLLEAEFLPVTSLVGAGAVVVGSSLSALGRRQARASA